MSKNYESKAKPTKITFTSRCSLKINDNHYTVEASEERTIDVNEDYVDLAEEWGYLCDEVNTIVDNQCEDIVKTFEE
jgi:hypothetical protein